MAAMQDDKITSYSAHLTNAIWRMKRDLGIEVEIEPMPMLFTPECYHCSIASLKMMART